MESVGIQKRLEMTCIGILDTPRNTVSYDRRCVYESARVFTVTKQYDVGDNREQLFDMAADPGEMRNLAVVNSYGDELNRHRQVLTD